MPIIILLIILFSILALWYVRKKVIQSNREKLYTRPLNDYWLTLIQDNIPIYKRIPNKLKPHYHGCIQIFLYEKDFIGRNIDITDQIRATVAGNACLLLLHGHQRRFPGFRSIIIYPETYLAKQTHHNGSLESIEHSQRAGESWVRGPIVLSWGDMHRGSINGFDGHNVVLHEFAHKLDEQSGDMNGLPVLREDSHYKEWAAVLNDEFSALNHRASRGKNSVLDQYGTVSAPEFFAVATESFFEKSKQMKKKLPDLYRQLSRFYNIDPADW